ncbi:unnamed protein product [Lupinus luteus]|uniref:Uncharacterized protein n=1 Tax=Lupinus luteus TaxID=3873 RepID=A0AAV1YFD4_LUPLU
MFFLFLLSLIHDGCDTPLLFKLIPAVVHLGMLLRWFSPDSLVEIASFKVENLRADSDKQLIILIDQESRVP